MFQYQRRQFCVSEETRESIWELIEATINIKVINIALESCDKQEPSSKKNFLRAKRQSGNLSSRFKLILVS